MKQGLLQCLLALICLTEKFNLHKNTFPRFIFGFLVSMKRRDMVDMCKKKSSHRNLKTTKQMGDSKFLTST